MAKITLDDLPAYDHPKRKYLFDLYLKSEYVQNKIKDEGLPFFTEDELAEIEATHKDGLTKKEVMSFIYRKWDIKEGTLKHYMQKKLIPSAQTTDKTKKGKISIYPSDIIRHVNFVRYSLFAKDTKDTLYKVVDEAIRNHRMILEEKSWNSEMKGDRGDNCIEALYIGFDYLKESAIPWTEISIKEGFAKNKKIMSAYLKKIDEIKNLTLEIEKRVDEFVEELENNHEPIISNEA
jgi:hypothetical protein